MGKGTSTAHLPYKWDKLGKPRRSYPEDGLAATRKHKKPATPGMAHVAATPAPKRPFSNG